MILRNRSGGGYRIVDSGRIVNFFDTTSIAGYLERNHRNLSALRFEGISEADQETIRENFEYQRKLRVHLSY